MGVGGTDTPGDLTWYTWPGRGAHDEGRWRAGPTQEEQEELKTMGSGGDILFWGFWFWLFIYVRIIFII